MSVLTNILFKQPETNRPFGFNFAPLLQPGVTVSTVALVEVLGPDASLVCGAPAVNASTFTDPDGVHTIAANKGCTASLSGGTDGKDYYVRIKATFSDGGVDVLTTPVQVRTRR